ncbi:hypothetical protein [Spirillospora sp. CA-294931]|uniref:hypothetical protein n=1 Tax=Spirillospora sp. CA-294931 TaxID=3240042 RepID=UPI003D8FF65F
MCPEFLLANPLGGRPPQNGGEFVFGDPDLGRAHPQTTTSGTLTAPPGTGCIPG